MKIQLLSDLHIEHAPYEFQDGGADVIVCAGDIGVGRNGLKWIEENLPVNDKPVLYVLGNHEYYDHYLDTLADELKLENNHPNIHIMDRDIFIHKGVRFLGCTLWTDCAVNGVSPVEAAAYIERGLADYYTIRKIVPIKDANLFEMQIINAQDTIGVHDAHLRWLQYELDHVSYDGANRTVIVTHHAPSPRSIHMKYMGSNINAGFASDLEEFIKANEINLWMHGHMHDPFHYEVHGCQVVCNPRGYPTEDNGFHDIKIIEV